MNLGWAHGIVCACPGPSSFFAFFAGGLGVVVVAASGCQVEVCASTTGNISGMVSRWHLFPYLSIFADFSSFPFLGCCISVRSFFWGHLTSNSTTTITFHMNTASILRGPGPLMRARAHHASSCWDRAHMGFFSLLALLM